MKQTVLVTGATGGIGTACIKAFAAHDVQVIGTTHREEGLQQLNAIPELHAGYLLDLADVMALRKKIASIIDRHGPINMLVNNAAFLKLESMFDITEETWDKTCDINMKAVFFLSQVMADHMRSLQTGAILHVASLAGKLGFVDQIPYSAAKAGVFALTRTMARELAPWNIRVHAVSPGAIDTPMFQHCLQWSEQVYQQSPTTLLHQWLAPTVNQRLIPAQQVAEILCYLALQGTMYLSGCCWNIDSGVAPF
ncbi:MAG TPA: SDR family oxidoreductase [Ktedonobacteraceae bacterium]|nr:SDR family oxidoreductase [Ktedonobacteraceae bacterium]